MLDIRTRGIYGKYIMGMLVMLIVPVVYNTYVRTSEVTVIPCISMVAKETATIIVNMNNDDAHNCCETYDCTCHTGSYPMLLTTTITW